MKKIVFILFLLTSFSKVWCQDNNNLNMVFDTTVYDFGQILKGSKAECAFVFHNKGKVPLIIRDVKASCGCTVPSWTREPVKPGGSGSIVVKYNSNSVGVFSKTITVYSSDNNRIVPLTVKGEVQKKK